MKSIISEFIFIEIFVPFDFHPVCLVKSRGPSLKKYTIFQTFLVAKAVVTRQTKLGKPVLANLSWYMVCVNCTKTVDKHVGKQLATNKTSLILAMQLFHQLCRVG